MRSAPFCTFADSKGRAAKYRLHSTDEVVIGLEKGSQTFLNAFSNWPRSFAIVEGTERERRAVAGQLAKDGLAFRTVGFPLFAPSRQRWWDQVDTLIMKRMESSECHFPVGLG
ncbi:unnamed protein product [Bursaphelenchus okinawaensis]|uniref:Uncharacterized protein n=1 Tax=Bursaphelenchus okinawaensis TaxID=465554 RepID=A0A811KW09_9BILA|nr:unnamed protein product [Bursaphelenchus okinawaensis]CAG9112311.1 unnamed protein product [Bursaphelenchus okinawaensis]